MSEQAVELERARAEMFEQFGRCVVALQHVEQLFKAVLNLGSFRGTLKQFRGHHEKLTAAVDKRTLGQLVESFLENHLVPVGDDTPPTEPPANPTEMTMACTFRIQLTPEQRAGLEKRLEKLTEQRNNLIHHSLDWLKWKTPEDCRTSLRQIKQQREELEPLRRELLSIATSAFEARNEALRLLLEELQRSSRPGG